MNENKTMLTEINNERINVDRYSNILEETPSIYYRAAVYLIAGFCIFLLFFVFVFKTQRIIKASGSFISLDSSIAIVAAYDCTITKSLVKIGDKVTKTTDIFQTDPIIGQNNPKLLKKKVNSLKEEVKSLQQALRILKKVYRNTNMISSYQDTEITNTLVNEQLSNLLKIHIQMNFITANNSRNNLNAQELRSLDLLKIEKKRYLSKIPNSIKSLETQLDQFKIDLQRNLLNLRLLQEKVYYSYIKSPLDGVIVELNTALEMRKVQQETIVGRILPSTAKLLVNAKVRSSHIHLVNLNDKVFVKVNSYPFQKFGLITGNISKISPQLGDAKHFVVTIQTAVDHLKSAGN
ncbi:HlyD family efflux transporter periplasmic adaptor subunit, partial [bacterium]|nr:HlyD family efflux transporter periplasmic adaptor subunit [bacterium]